MPTSVVQQSASFKHALRGFLAICRTCPYKHHETHMQRIHTTYLAYAPCTVTRVQSNTTTTYAGLLQNCADAAI